MMQPGHLVLVHQPCSTLRDVFVEAPPVGVRLTGTGVADEVEQHGETLAAVMAFALVIAGRQPDMKLPLGRVAQRVVSQDRRVVTDTDHRAGLALKALDRHRCRPGA